MPIAKTQYFTPFQLYGFALNGSLYIFLFPPFVQSSFQIPNMAILVSCSVSLLPFLVLSLAINVASEFPCNQPFLHSYHLKPHHPPLFSLRAFSVTKKKGFLFFFFTARFPFFQFRIKKKRNFDISLILTASFKLVCVWIFVENHQNSV